MVNYNPMSKEFQEEAKKRGMNGNQYMQWLKENANMTDKEKTYQTSPIPIIPPEEVLSRRKTDRNITIENHKENKFDVSDTEKDIVILDTLDGFEFEKVCRRIFTKLKYGRVEKTQDTCDGGRDLLIYGDDGLTIVESKHQPYSSVGRPVVQKLHSATISSGGIKGILVTTGKFSNEAIEHAKTLEPPIELVDRAILTDLATRAGIRLIIGGKECPITTYGIYGLDDIRLKIDQFIISRFENYPKGFPLSLQILNRNVFMYPTYIIRYDIDSIFETSIGVIHKESIEDGIILIDGINGEILQKELADRFGSSHLQIFNKSDYMSSNLITDGFQIDENTVKQKSKEYISALHTENISYSGSTSRIYTKLCVPKDNDILITDIKQVYIPRQEINIDAKIFQKDYDIKIIEENSKYIAYHTKIFDCTICGGHIRKNAVICHSCGSIVHSNKLLDSHSFKCKICGKPICRKCTYDLGFQNKMCKECVIKNGNDLIPISMKMNQRNIISFVGMGTGIFLIYIGIGIAIILIIVCILILLSKEGLEKSPYYEYIQK